MQQFLGVLFLATITSIFVGIVTAITDVLQTIKDVYMSNKEDNS